MKRIVFSVQVFGLIVALPLYVITELNQVKSTATLPEAPAAVVETPELPVSMVLSDTTIVFESQYLALKKQYSVISNNN